jgi:alpha-amylase
VRVTSVVLYFQVHPPYRLRSLRAVDIGKGKPRFDEAENRRILRRVAERCYQPMNRLLLEAIQRTEGRFRCAFSLSGTVLRQLEDWAPRALASFVELAESGAVEFLAETSHHSLAALVDPAEWEAQVAMQGARVEALFGQRPTSFRNTELVISAEIARRVEALGFQALLGEGTELLLGERDVHVPYRPEGCRKLSLLLRDYRLSDDIAFRFSNRAWPEHPLMADRYARWIHDIDREAEFVGLFMDYETFGEHQPVQTGIFEFMRALPAQILAGGRADFATPREVAARATPRRLLPIPRPFSWADERRDLSAWLANPMQRAAHEALYQLGPAARASGDPELLESWRRLSTSDHVYYMATARWSDAEVHEYFSPYGSPHEAFVNFMNVLEDLGAELQSGAGSAAAAPEAGSARKKKKQA